MIQIQPDISLFFYCDATNELGTLLPKLSNTCFLFSASFFKTLLFILILSNVKLQRYQISMRKPRQTCSKSPLKQGERNTKSICLCNLPIWDFLHAYICFIRGNLALQFSVKPLLIRICLGKCHVQSRSKCIKQLHTNSGESILYFINCCLYYLVLLFNRSYQQSTLEYLCK